MPFAPSLSVVMTVALLFSVYLNYIMPENVFLVIASLATFATVWVWIMILLSQIAFRRRLSPEEAEHHSFAVSLPENRFQHGDRQETAPGARIDVAS